MFNMKKITFAFLAVAFMPLVTYADNIKDLKGLITYVVGILNSIVPLLFALALVGFIWGIVKYIYAASPQALGEARNYIIFSIIAIAVMLSVWGLALMLKNTFFDKAVQPYTPAGDTSGNHVGVFPPPLR